MSLSRTLRSGPRHLSPWWSTFRKLGTCSNSEALSPRTVLIENICESVQQILQHKPGNKALSNKLHINRSTQADSYSNKERNTQLTKTWRLWLVVLFLSSVVVGDGQKAWQMIFRTGPRPKSSWLEQYWQKIFVDVFNKYKTLTGNNGLSNNVHNNPFQPGFSSSPGWLLVTRTRGAWWCRYRGHVRP